MRLLLVEDDRMLGAGLQAGLRQKGWAVDWVRDGDLADQALRGEPYDVVLLDLGLPGMGGLEVLRGLRARGGSAPVLILTAQDAVPDRVTGLDAGADDYLVKPFALQELVLRLRALLRRRPEPEDRLRVGPLEVDPATRTVRYLEAEVPLTRREFELLEVLARNAGLVLSRDQLLDRVWGYDFDVRSDVVDTFVSYLRRKLEADGRPRIVHTVRGVGFSLRDPS
jgi:two-component system response regulator PrrA